MLKYIFHNLLEGGEGGKISDKKNLYVVSIKDKILRALYNNILLNILQSNELQNVSFLLLYLNFSISSLPSLHFESSQLSANQSPVFCHMHWI